MSFASCSPHRMLLVSFASQNLSLGLQLMTTQFLYTTMWSSVLTEIAKEVEFLSIVIILFVLDFNAAELISNTSALKFPLHLRDTCSFAASIDRQILRLLGCIHSTLLPIIYAAILYHAFCWAISMSIYYPTRTWPTNLTHPSVLSNVSPNQHCYAKVCNTNWSCLYCRHRMRYV